MSESTAEAPAQEQPASTTEEAPKPAEEQPAKADETDWKAEARKWEQRAKENKGEVQSAQQQLDAIAKALGLKGEEAPDPAKLAEQLTTEQQNAREARVQLAVYRNARDHEADADALLDSASFLRGLSDVAPSDSEAVSAAIKTFVEANPRFKASAPSTVAPSFGGGPRPSADKPDPGPGVARLRDAYSSSTK